MKKEIRHLTDTPTVNTSAYASGDTLGSLITFSNALIPGCTGSAIIESCFVTSLSSAFTIDVVFFSSNPSSTTFTNNAALDIADADLSKICAVVQLDKTVSFADNAAIFPSNEDTVHWPIVLSDQETLYAVMVSRGTPTLGGTSDITLHVGLVQYI